MAMAVCICNFCNGNGMKVPFARNPGTSTPFQFIGIANTAGLYIFFSCLLQLLYAKALSPVCVGICFRSNNLRIQSFTYYVT